MPTFSSNAVRQPTPPQFLEPHSADCSRFSEPSRVQAISVKPNASQPQPVWDCEEAAQFLRIHPKTVKRLAGIGRLPGFRVGNRWRFRPSELDDWARSALRSDHSLRRE